MDQGPKRFALPLRERGRLLKTLEALDLAEGLLPSSFLRAGTSSEEGSLDNLYQRSPNSITACESRPVPERACCRPWECVKPWQRSEVTLEKEQEFGKGSSVSLAFGMFLPDLSMGILMPALRRCQPDHCSEHVAWISREGLRDSYEPWPSMLMLVATVTRVNSLSLSQCQVCWA